MTTAQLVANLSSITLQTKLSDARRTDSIRAAWRLSDGREVLLIDLECHVAEATGDKVWSAPFPSDMGAGWAVQCVMARAAGSDPFAGEEPTTPTWCPRAVSCGLIGAHSESECYGAEASDDDPTAGGPALTMAEVRERYPEAAARVDTVIASGGSLLDAIGQAAQSLCAEADRPRCDHGVTFDLAAAKGLDANEVRHRWPRLRGSCPKGCGFSGIAYASFTHHLMGDW